MVPPPRQGGAPSVIPHPAGTGWGTVGSRGKLTAVCAAVRTPEHSVAATQSPRLASPANSTSQAPEFKIHQRALAAWEIMIYFLSHSHTHTICNPLFSVSYTFNYLRINLISPLGKSLFCFLLISLSSTLHLTKLGETTKTDEHRGREKLRSQCGLWRRASGWRRPPQLLDRSYKLGVVPCAYI